MLIKTTYKKFFFKTENGDREKEDQEDWEKDNGRPES